MESHCLPAAYVKDGRVMAMSEAVSVRRFACTWPAVDIKLQLENPLEYAFCINYIKREKLRNGFRAKKICKATKEGTKITFEKMQSREEVKEAAAQVIDEYFDLVERRDKEQGARKEAADGT